MFYRRILSSSLLLATLLLCNQYALSQTGPSNSEAATYKGLHHAAYIGDAELVKELILKQHDIELPDRAGRTPLHIAAFASNEEIIGVLSNAGANMNALEHQAYDIVTIAAVENDVELLQAALEHGASPANITSPYDGTALIAAAHLGHHEVVKVLIDAGAPLDHINNLNWTALIEAVVLGDGGPDHVKTVEHLIRAGANQEIGDQHGQTPLELAKSRGFVDIVTALERVGPK